MKHSQVCWCFPNGDRLTPKEMNYLVVGLFDDLVAPLLYLCL